jgi:hypothetical protein
MLNELKHGPGPLHPIDLEVFAQYPARIFEVLARENYTQINYTDAFYGPMLWAMIRANHSLNVVEIGVGEGYCSYFMAQAVRENIARDSVPGRYLGIDISDRCKDLFDKMAADGLPVEYKFVDSATLKPEDLLHDGRPVDLLFQDGNHHIDQTLKEIDIIYPALRGNGEGYLCCHDVYAYCEQYAKILRTNPKFKFEHISFLYNYGFGIFRKMDGYDYEKVFWPITEEDKQKKAWG